MVNKGERVESKIDDATGGVGVLILAPVSRPPSAECRHAMLRPCHLRLWCGPFCRLLEMPLPKCAPGRTSETSYLPIDLLRRAVSLQAFALCSSGRARPCPSAAQLPP